MKKSLIAIVLGVLVLGAAVVAGMMVGKKKEGGATNTTTNTDVRAQTNTAATTPAEDSATIIANVTSAIRNQLTGMNNNGQPFEQWLWVDQRIGDDLYLAVIRYNADTYGISGDYKPKMQREKDEIIAKAAAVSKAIMDLGYPMGIISFEAYTGQSNPQYKVEMEKQQLDTVDWSQDAATLATTLPSVWSVLTDGYAFYLNANTSS
jgi:hypothetical protein